MCYLLSEICNQPSILMCFFEVFVPNSMTLPTFSRIIQSVTGSVTVEHPCKKNGNMTDWDVTKV